MKTDFREPVVSVIVPMYNAATTLEACLAAIQRARDGATELLVVDDGCTDDSAAIAQEAGARVIRNTRHKGPAGARNQGADEATGDILLFVDADVVIQENTVSRVRDLFRAQPELSAIFGSYDAEPEARNFLSQYKNLFHHYVHQNAREESSSFWSGCGAIRTNVFHASGGFDEATYSHASIEDIEFGWRLFQSGHRTQLVKSLRVKHLKRWTAAGLLKADILYRAVPWTRLIASSGNIPNDLNLHTSQRISALLVWTAIGTAIASIAWPVCLAVMCVCLAGVVLLNLDFYRFFLRHRGVWFTMGVFFWHLLYFIYSSVVFAFYWPYHKFKKTAKAQ